MFVREIYGKRARRRPSHTWWHLPKKIVHLVYQLCNDMLTFILHRTICRTTVAAAGTALPSGAGGVCHEPHREVHIYSDAAVRLHRVFRSIEEHSSITENDDIVREVFHSTKVMACHNDATFPVMDNSADGTTCDVRGIHVHSIGRLIEEEEIAGTSTDTGHQREHHRQDPLLSTREYPGRNARARLHAKCSQHISDKHLAATTSAVAASVRISCAGGCGNGEMALDAQCGPERIALGTEHHTGCIYGNRARSDVFHSTEHAHHGRLSASILTKQHCDRAASDRHRNASQSSRIAIPTVSFRDGQESCRNVHILVLVRGTRRHESALH